MKTKQRGVVPFFFLIILVFRTTFRVSFFFSSSQLQNKTGCVLFLVSPPFPFLLTPPHQLFCDPLDLTKRSNVFRSRSRKRTDQAILRLAGEPRLAVCQVVVPCPPEDVVET